MDMLAVAVEDGAAVALVQDALATWGSDGYGHSEAGEASKTEHTDAAYLCEEAACCPGGGELSEARLSCREKNSGQGEEGVEPGKRETCRRGEGLIGRAHKSARHQSSGLKGLRKLHCLTA